MKTIDWTLCLIADAKIAGRNILSHIKEAVEAGVTIVQLRAKTLEIREFLELALQTQEILRTKNIPLIINDRIDVALSSDASGAHLGQEDLPLPLARRIMGRNKLIGTSVNTLEEARQAELHGADYLGVGPVFFTPTKIDQKPILGIPGLKRIRDGVKTPILAIGGITSENAGEIMASGANGIAVVSAILEAKDISAATKELLSSIK